MLPRTNTTSHLNALSTLVASFRVHVVTHKVLAERREWDTTRVTRCLILGVLSYIDAYYPLPPVPMSATLVTAAHTSALNGTQMTQSAFGLVLVQSLPCASLHQHKVTGRVVPVTHIAFSLPSHTALVAAWLDYLGYFLHSIA